MCRHFRCKSPMFLSSTAYCASSVFMILGNKTLLSSYQFQHFILLMFIQNILELNGYDVDINETSKNYIHYVIETAPQYGVLDVLTNTDLMNKQIKYTPSENYFGSDSFSYYVKDNYGVVSNTANASITVTSVNDLPVFTSTPTVTTIEDSVYTYEITVTDIENKITSIAVRLFNVYGPRQDQRMVVSRFINQAKKNKPITIYGSGKQTRDFTFIDDCVKVFDLLNKKVNGFQIINSSKGKDLNILSLAKKIKKDLRSQSKIVHIEIPEKLEEFQVPKRCGNSSKLNKLINYSQILVLLLV